MDAHLRRLCAGLPDFAAYTQGHHESERYLDIFDSVMCYLLESGNELAPGHTMQVGDDAYLRCRAPRNDEHWLESKGDVLVVDVIRADQINQ